MTPFEALVAHVREHYTSDEWMHLETWQRNFISTTAAAKHGTVPLPPTTLVVQRVGSALRASEKQESQDAKFSMPPGAYC